MNSATLLIQETVTPRPPRTPPCGWTLCTAMAIGGAFSDRDKDFVLPLCGMHLTAVSVSLWGRRSA